MQKELIAGKSKHEWLKEYPLLEKISGREEVIWLNPDYTGMPGMDDVQTGEAEERLKRFAPYISKVFPETSISGGLIESPLQAVPVMQKLLEESYGIRIPNQLLVKLDSHLPISGSVKARGGIYEVLAHAEKLALESGLLSMHDDYSIMDSNRFRDFFSNFSIAVGSTGNLGLSIGVMAVAIGFRVTVHMSADAKQWKKDLLREKGAVVVEYKEDYSLAVAEGRKQAAEIPGCHFIDDENSIDLFTGYATAGPRLAAQLAGMRIEVNEGSPLFVYLPCGVGGGPGGIAYGLKQQFGEHVHCFFAEPLESPCFLIGQMTGLYGQVSVHDFGLTNRTEADGLAVGRASSFAGRKLRHILAGCYTISDLRLLELLRWLYKTEGIFLEPSALAGFYGPVQTGLNQEWDDTFRRGHHLVWATGGSLVPVQERERYIK